MGRLVMFSLQPYRAPLIRELEDWVGPTLVVRGLAGGSRSLSTAVRGTGSGSCSTAIRETGSRLCSIAFVVTNIRSGQVDHQSGGPAAGCVIH